MKDAQILDGWCQRVAQNLSRTQFNISHVKKKKRRSLDGQPCGVKMRCLALHWCLLNNSWRLLKWPQTQTYKLLIVSTMIVYNGSLELYINNKAFLFSFFFFFLKPFPAGWVWGFQRNTVCVLHLEVESVQASSCLLHSSCGLHEEETALSFYTTPAQIQRYTQNHKTIGIGKGIHSSTRFRSDSGKQL